MTKSADRSFKPAWWCRGAHVQTIAGAFVRIKPPVSLNRERLETPDGDFLDIDYLDGAAESTGRSPLVVILHGLEGSSKSPYVRSLLGGIAKLGWQAAVLNMRMCSGEPNRLLQTYHSGKTEDLEFVLRHLEKTRTYSGLYLTGYSIGGNIVLKWLGEQGGGAAGRVRAAAAVSVPYNLVKSVELMDRGFNREVYTRLLLGSLKVKAFAKRKSFPDAMAYERVKRCRTFRVFDHEVTARLNGFTDETDYWTRSSCCHFLKAIRVKTLLIHAGDDPFFPGRLIPVDEIHGNPALELLMSSGGGHLGFVDGASQDGGGEPWLERTILNFLKASAAELQPQSRSTQRKVMRAEV